MDRSNPWILSWWVPVDRRPPCIPHSDHLGEKLGEIGKTVASGSFSATSSPASTSTRHRFILDGVAPYASRLR
jgi:hypothetical protein